MGFLSWRHILIAPAYDDANMHRTAHISPRRDVATERMKIKGKSAYSIGARKRFTMDDGSACAPRDGVQIDHLKLISTESTVIVNTEFYQSNGRVTNFPNVHWTKMQNYQYF